MAELPSPGSQVPDEDIAIIYVFFMLAPLGSPALLRADPVADSPKSIPVGVLVSRGTVAQADTPTLNLVLARQATGQEQL